jgi:hypothetical protein
MVCEICNHPARITEFHQISGIDFSGLICSRCLKAAELILARNPGNGTRLLLGLKLRRRVEDEFREKNMFFSIPTPFSQIKNQQIRLS